MEFLISRLVPLMVSLFVFMGIYKLVKFKSFANDKLKINTTVKSFILVLVLTIIMYLIVRFIAAANGISMLEYGGLISASLAGFVLATFHELAETEK